MSDKPNVKPDTPLLEVKELHKSYGGRPVVDGLSFHVQKGEIVALLGPNGAGKTTAFYMAIGLIRPDRGTVLFEDSPVTHLPMHKRAQLGMGYLAQEPSVFRTLTVEQNIWAVLETLSLSRSAKRQRCEELLAELRLESVAKKYAGTLSGGERRRLEITRALVTQPTCLLLDEPFANIDPLAIHDVQELVRHLVEKKGIAILITDHNAREVFSLVHRSYLVRAGKVFCSGTVDELLVNEEVRHSYLGHHFKL